MINLKELKLSPAQKRILKEVATDRGEFYIMQPTTSRRFEELKIIEKPVEGHMFNKYFTLTDYGRKVKHALLKNSFTQGQRYWGKFSIEKSSCGQYVEIKQDRQVIIIPLYQFKTKFIHDFLLPAIRKEIKEKLCVLNSGSTRDIIICMIFKMLLQDEVTQ